MFKGLLVSWELHDNNGEHSFERGRQGGKAVAWPKQGKEVKQRTTFSSFPLARPPLLVVPLLVVFTTLAPRR